MATDLSADIAAVQGIAAVPRILEVVCRSTGMGFAAVARVTEQRWICCAVRDEIAFGLTPGGELQVETTICHEIRQSGEAVVIDSVADDLAYCGHHTPAQYGFQSYISMPIILADGSFFGTLVRDRSAAGASEHAADDRHVQTVRRTDRDASGCRSTASPPARHGCSASARPRNCASSSSPCSAMICAIRWRRSRREPIC